MLADFVWVGPAVRQLDRPRHALSAPPARQPHELASVPGGRVGAQAHGIFHERPGGFVGRLDLGLSFYRAKPAMKGFAARMNDQPQRGPPEGLCRTAQVPMESGLLVECARIKFDHEPAPGPRVVQTSV